MKFYLIYYTNRSQACQSGIQTIMVGNEKGKRINVEKLQYTEYVADYKNE